MSSRNSEQSGNLPSRSSRTSMSRGGGDSEAGVSRATVALPLSRQHEIHIYRNGWSTQVFSWWVVDSEGIVDHSRFLFERIGQDKRHGRSATYMAPIPPVTATALHNIVKVISRSNTGGRLTPKKDDNFESFLDLSIALWVFNCSTKLFASFANDIRDSQWNQAAESRKTQYEGWVFAALVFLWGDVFEEASRELISDHPSHSDLQDYLPIELKEAIHERRRKLEEETSSFVRQVWMELWDTCRESMDTISTRLQELDISLSKSKFPEHFSPQQLLQSFESVLKDPPRDPQPTPQTNRSSTSKSIIRAAAVNRQAVGARVGAMARVNFAAYALAKISRDRQSQPLPQPPSAQKSEFLKRWETVIVPMLRQRITDFRQDKFKGLKIQEFIGLRNDNMLEIETAQL